MTSEAPAFRNALDAIADALDAERVRWAVTGSFALAYYGVVRATHDIDLKVAVERDDEATLATIGRRLPAGFRAVDATTWQYRDVLDVKVYALDGEIDRESLARRAKVQLFPGVSRRYWVVSPEDLVLSKLRELVRWRDIKQVDDLRKLAVALRASLDWPYLETRFARHPGFEAAWDEWVEGPVP